MKKKSSKTSALLSDFWPSLGSVLLVIIQGVIDMGGLFGIPLLVWLAILLMVIQFLKPQRELSKIKNSLPELVIGKPHIEGVLFDETGTSEYYHCVYVDISTENAIAENVYPKVKWISGGKKVLYHFEGSDCWWKGTEKIPKEEFSQSVTLYPNGGSRRLFLVRMSDSGELSIWHRGEDGIARRLIIGQYNKTYFIDVVVRSSNSAVANRRVMIRKEGTILKYE